jgi:hypothetical protein
MTAEISDSDKIKLTGRIYPAIQNCVGNRYKIIVGYFAVVGVVLFDREKLRIFVESGAAVFTAVIFTLFAIHNLINYWMNAIEQEECEKTYKRCPTMEISSSAVMLFLIWGGFFWLYQLYCLLPYLYVT